MHPPIVLADSEYPPPTKLWQYDYITIHWKDAIVYSGIGEKRAKSFLSELSLVNGSENGGVETRWSGCHELWEGTVEATGHKAIFFSGDSIDELCNLLAEQVDQVPKGKIKPGGLGSIVYA